MIWLFIENNLKFILNDWAGQRKTAKFSSRNFIIHHDSGEELEVLNQKSYHFWYNEDYVVQEER